MTRFEFANKVGDRVKALAKLPGKKKSIKRAFEASIDSLEDRNIDLEEKIDELRERLYTENKSVDRDSIIISIAESRMEMEDNLQAIKIIKEEEAYMEEEVELPKED